MTDLAAGPSGARVVDRGRDRFFAGGAVDGVRAEILASWRRSRLLGADPSPSRWQLPYEPHFDEESPLLRAAGPVLDRLAAQVAGEDVALILSDRRGRIVARRVGEGSLLRQLDDVEAVEGFIYSEDSAGTNGLGTAVETGRPIEVVGSEHYADRLAELTCVGVPLIHPMTRRLAGVVDITCYAKRTNRLLRPLVAQAARDVMQRLYLQRNIAERALLQHFLRATRSTARPVIVINDRCVISNSAASRLLAGVEHDLLWEHAARTLDAGTARDVELDGPEGHLVRVRVTPLFDGSVPVGALLEGRPSTSTHRHAAPDKRAPTLPGLVGRSAVWRTCCAHAWQAACACGQLTLIGEQGTGKSALAAGLHEVLRSGGPLSVTEGATVCLGDPPSWLAGLRDNAAASAPGTLVVRDMHLLSGDLLRALRPVLRELRERGWLVIGTETRTADEDRAAVSTVGGAWVEVPPLRDRLCDVPNLVAEFVARHARLTGHRREVGAEVIQVFQRLTWPGNVAQLEALVGSLLARPGTGPVRTCEIPGGLVRTTARRPLTRLECAEIHAILVALQATAGNKKGAAALLGVSRSTLYRKLHSTGINLDGRVY